MFTNLSTFAFLAINRCLATPPLTSITGTIQAAACLNTFICPQTALARSQKDTKHAYL